MLGEVECSKGCEVGFKVRWDVVKGHWVLEPYSVPSSENQNPGVG